MNLEKAFHDEDHEEAVNSIACHALAKQFYSTERLLKINEYPLEILPELHVLHGKTAEFSMNG